MCIAYVGEGGVSAGVGLGRVGAFYAMVLGAAGVAGDRVGEEGVGGR